MPKKKEATNVNLQPSNIVEEEKKKRIKPGVTFVPKDPTAAAPGAPFSQAFPQEFTEGDIPLTQQEIQKEDLQQQYEQIQRGVAAQREGLKQPIGTRPERGRAPSVEALTDKAGLPAGYNITFDLSAVGDPASPESIKLTNEQYNQYLRGDTTDPVVAEALRYKRAMSLTSEEAWRQFQEQGRIRAQQRLMSPEQLEFPELVQVPERPAGVSALREAGAFAITGAAGGAVVGGFAGGVGAIPGAIIGGIGGFIAGILKTYGGEHKEEVANAWQGFRGIKTGVTMIPTTMRTGGISAAQAQVYYAYAEAEINAMESRLKEKFETEYVADIADADGKLRYIREYKQFYLPMIKAQIDMKTADPNFIPESVTIPDYEGED